MKTSPTASASDQKPMTREITATILLTLILWRRPMADPCETQSCGLSDRLPCLRMYVQPSSPWLLVIAADDLPSLLAWSRSFGCPWASLQTIYTQGSSSSSHRTSSNVDHSYVRILFLNDPLPALIPSLFLSTVRRIFHMCRYNGDKMSVVVEKDSWQCLGTDEDIRIGDMLVISHVHVCGTRADIFACSLLMYMLSAGLQP